MAGQFDAHSVHRNRLRQRVLSGGFEGLQPHEIIEFLLYYAIPRQDVNELAHALIRRFGSVQGNGAFIDHESSSLLARSSMADSVSGQKRCP